MGISLTCSVMKINFNISGVKMEEIYLKKINPVTYTQGDKPKGNPVKKFFLRLGRKLTFWYIDPFGENQNSFNENTAQRLDSQENSISNIHQELTDIDRLCSQSTENSRQAADTALAISAQVKALEERLSAVEKLSARTDELLNGEIKNTFAHIGETGSAALKTASENRAELNSYIRTVNPQLRRDNSDPDCFSINEQLSACLTDSLLKRPDTDEELEIWGSGYRKTITEEFERLSADSKENIIAVICKRFMASIGIEAVRSEALELYNMLKKYSKYTIRFISIEPELNEITFNGDICCVPERNCGKFINSLDPVLCVFCESTPHIIMSDGCSMILRHSILKLSAQNPIQDLTQNTIAELTHLNDFGLHKYLVQSRKAAEILTDNGFHEPLISYPLISHGKIYPRKRIFSRDSFTVGFASSPMEEKQSADRGVDLLYSIAASMPDVTFEILWRYDTAFIPPEFEDLKNCRFIFGRHDMQQFFDSIDCLIIPYTSINCNHACSLSAVEAMENGIPVLCTDISGISEIVTACGMGEAAPPECEPMSAALNKILSGYEIYTSPLKKQSLDKYLDNSDLLNIIESEAERDFTAKPVTLYEWDRRLKLNEKYLVQGHRQMKEYYQQQEVADKYTAVRFTSRALKSFDFIERQNIGIIIDSAFHEKTPEILDVACGDGRITGECLRHGNVTSIDASNAMLNIVKNRFAESDNIPVTKICDVITDDITKKYDVITCFRYIRHFDYKTRKLIYKKFLDSLNENGIIIFDVPNIDLELPLKEATGWQNYNIYDVFWTKNGIAEELKNNGLKIKYIIPTGQGLMSQLPDDIRRLPMTWTVGAVKK